MTHIINNDCISCSASEAECPENAISEGDNIYIINPSLCTDCGVCVEFCPVEAIDKQE